jgi:hypothetical protein
MRVASSYPGLAGPGTERSADRSIPCDAAALALCKAREAFEGSSGEGPDQISIACPGRENPKGASGDARAKTRGASRGTLGRVKAQKPRSVEPAPASAGKYQTGQRYVGSSSRKRGDSPPERSKLRRVNPMSAAGMKQNRPGFEGSKPSRG